MPIKPKINYCIVVQGDVTSLSRRFGEMTATVKIDKKYGIITTLKGPFIDQSELLGALNSIYEFNFTILQIQASNYSNSNNCYQH